MKNEPILQIRGLKTRLLTSRGVLFPVDGVDLTVSRGKTVGLVGESGCGKSLTAMSVMQLLKPPACVAEGEILFEGENLLKKTKKEMNHIRGKRISMIFQEPMTSLNPVYTVGSQVAEVILTHEKNVSKKEARRRAVHILREVGISQAEKRYASFPHQLSGGLRQRIMIGMAIACHPLLMIADEATTALDVTTEAQILYLLSRLQKEYGTAILMITHNLGVVAQTCDYVCVMYAGKIVEETSVDRLFSQPLHPYTYGLIHCIPNLRKKTDRLYSISGLVPSLESLPRGCHFFPRCPKAMDICAASPPRLYEAAQGHRVRCFLYQKEE